MNLAEQPSHITLPERLAQVQPHLHFLLQLTRVIHDETALTDQMREDLREAMEVLEVHFELIRYTLD